MGGCVGKKDKEKKRFGVGGQCPSDLPGMVKTNLSPWDKHQNPYAPIPPPPIRTITGDPSISSGLNTPMATDRDDCRPHRGRRSAPSPITTTSQYDGTTNENTKDETGEDRRERDVRVVITPVEPRRPTKKTPHRPSSVPRPLRKTGAPGPPLARRWSSQDDRTELESEREMKKPRRRRSIDDPTEIETEREEDGRVKEPLPPTMAQADFQKQLQEIWEKGGGIQMVGVPHGDKLPVDADAMGTSPLLRAPKKKRATKKVIRKKKSRSQEDLGEKVKKRHRHHKDKAHSQGSTLSEEEEEEGKPKRKTGKRQPKSKDKVKGEQRRDTRRRTKQKERDGEAGKRTTRQKSKEKEKARERTEDELTEDKRTTRRKGKEKYRARERTKYETTEDKRPSREEAKGGRRQTKKKRVSKDGEEGKETPRATHPRQFPSFEEPRKHKKTVRKTNKKK